MIVTRVLFFIMFLISIANGAGGSGGSSGSSGSGSSGGSGDSADGGGNWSSEYDAELSPIMKMINNEKFEDALLELEIFVYANPQSADGWNYIGFVSRQLEKYEDAERYYELGLEINPKHKGILEYQGELFLKTNRIDLARENLSKLNDMCSFNCTYRDQLAKKISAQ